MKNNSIYINGETFHFHGLEYNIKKDGNSLQIDMSLA